MGSRRPDPYCGILNLTILKSYKHWSWNFVYFVNLEHLERISPSDVDKGKIFKIIKMLIKYYWIGYPPFLRINPIIDWSYEQVWEFLRHFEIPYCNLYEKGFTYLGNKKNTL